MKIKINDLMNGSKIDFDFTVEKMEDILLKEPVHLVGEAFKEENVYVVKGHFKALVQTECVKCLASLYETVEGDFQEKFLDSKSYSKYLSNLKEEEELEDEVINEAVNGELEIIELVREHIILGLSLYPVCDPVCEDTSVLDKYSDDGIDPRWQQLLQIKN
ncbi:YceD family protein [Cetobacterium sp. SF1]|uniref:YceD family protein n=1 Tax=unclassified Cetobacterium TaxID=2630983 RepID=UPI003CE96AE3